MQRGTTIIALAEDAAQGGLVVRGEAQAEAARSVFWTAPEGTPEERLSRSLEALLDGADWPRGGCVLVLPTALVSHRKLHFGFADARKIRQVLPFELESELLDPLARYVYDAEVQPHADGSADVHVYLAERTLLERLSTLLEQHQFILQRVVFSAHALAQANPGAARAHFHVYVGSDEAYVAHSVDGVLQGAQTLVPHPGELLPQLRSLGEGAPSDLLRTLFREGPELPARDGLRQALQARLEAVCTEVTRLIRIKSAAAPCSVSLHGLFTPALAWNAAEGALEVRLPQGAWPGAQDAAMGALDSLLANPRPLLARGLNFHKRVGTWVALARDLRWPLVAAAVLLALLALVGGGGYYLRAGALQAHLRSVERQLQAELSLSGPLTSVTINAALSRAQERVERLRKERQAVAYLDRYHYDTLKLFRDLSEAVRQQTSVTVDALSFNQERFVLSGTTPSYADSEALKGRIAALPRFSGRTVGVTHSNAGQSIRYRLTAER